MSGKTLVVIYDPNDEKRGEITIVDSAQKAARLAETLLEAGFEKDRIRIFTGGEMSIQVTHRPVVALVEGGDTVTPTASETAEEAPRSSKGAPEAEPALVKTSQKDAPLSLSRDGIRFSQAFRPA